MQRTCISTRFNFFIYILMKYEAFYFQIAMNTLLYMDIAYTECFLRILILKFSELCKYLKNIARRKHHEDFSLREFFLHQVL